MRAADGGDVGHDARTLWLPARRPRHVPPAARALRISVAPSARYLAESRWARRRDGVGERVLLLPLQEELSDEARSEAEAGLAVLDETADDVEDDVVQQHSDRGDDERGAVGGDELITPPGAAGDATDGSNKACDVSDAMDVDAEGAEEGDGDGNSPSAVPNSRAEGTGRSRTRRATGRSTDDPNIQVGGDAAGEARHQSQSDRGGGALRHCPWGPPLRKRALAERTLREWRAHRARWPAGATQPGAAARLDRPQHAHLSHNFVGANSMSVDELREALANNTSITNLSLRRCCIGGWRRARAIARGLARNTVLTTVDLSYNGLGAASSQLHVAGGAGEPAHPPNAAASRLAASEATLWLSKRSARLSALRPAFAAFSLAHNGLGDRGGEAVIVASLASPSMRHLDLRANGLSVEGLRRMCALLASHHIAWLPRRAARSDRLVRGCASPPF